MGIGTATHQKTTLLQLSGNRIAHQRRWCPARLHLVVVPRLGAIKTETIGCGDQPLEGQAIAGGMGKQQQAPAWCPASSTASAWSAGPTSARPCR